jgi:RNA polymerase-binding transcription factor DksA
VRPTARPATAQPTGQPDAAGVEGADEERHVVKSGAGSKATAEAAEPTARTTGRTKVVEPPADEAKAAPKATKAAAPAAPAKPKPAAAKDVPAAAPEAKLSAKTLEKLRKTLIDERDVILRQASALEAEAEALANDRDGGDTQFDEESGEGDSLNIERERDLMLSAHAHKTLEEIDAALARMDAGTYGICEVSGKQIPIERLEAIPWARVRAEVQAKRERRR